MNKEKLQKKASEMYQNLSKEEKDKKWQYGCERYENTLKIKNKGLLSIEKSIFKWRKMIHNH